MEALLTDIALIIILGSFFALIARFLKQPLLVGYIIAGILIGPHGLNYIHDEHTILVVSELGITFLLFLVGLELNINKIKEVGRIVVFGGMLQMVLTAALTGLLSLAFGYSFLVSFYLGIALAFSSTLIGIKYLSERKGIDSTHGRIVVGILVLQDIAAILIVSILPTITSFSITKIGVSALNGIFLIVLAVIIEKLILSALFRAASKSDELLFLLSLAVCFIFANLALMVGFSLTIGAFLAGVMIANLPYSIEIIGKLKSLTIFFTVLFFVGLGMQILPGTLPQILPMLAFFLFLALVVKPILVYGIIRKYGYDRKVSFLGALALGQVSEFSLIIASQGALLGHIGSDIISLVIAMTILSMAISTYLLNNDIGLFLRLQHLMGMVDRILGVKDDSKTGAQAGSLKDAEIIINGYRNFGQTVFDTVQKSGKSVLVVDDDLDTVRMIEHRGMRCVYGHLGDHELLEKIDIEKSKVIVSGYEDLFENLALLGHIRKVNKTALIVVFSPDIEESLKLYTEGADFVVVASLEGERRVCGIIDNYLSSPQKLVMDKIHQIEVFRKHQDFRRKGHLESQGFFKDVRTLYRSIRPQKQKR